MSKPQLGQTIQASKTLIKIRNHNETTWAGDGKPVLGVYVGKRTLREGKGNWNSFGGNQYEWEWTQTGSFEAWLIAFDEHRKPVFALPEDCILITPALADAFNADDVDDKDSERAYFTQSRLNDIGEIDTTKPIME